MLDYIFSSRRSDVVHGVVDNCVSDHKTILANTAFNFREMINPIVWKRLYGDNSVNNFLSDVLIEHWDSMHKCENVDSA